VREDKDVTRKPLEADAGDVRGPAGPSPGGRILAAGAAVLVSAVIVAVTTTPVTDSDLWFHLAYGRYLLEHETLVPDHTAFSWTPTDNDTIYCAWIPEVVFHLLHERGGMALLSVLRALVLACVVALAAATAGVWRGRGGRPVFALVLLLSVLMSQAGLRVKPELFSYLFMAVSTWAWLHARSRPEGPSPWIYLLPLIMLFWVNSHGAFIFGLVFAACVFAGEAVNLCVPGRDARLQRGALGHAAAAFGLTLAATLVTPYGAAYPAKLLDTMILHPGEFAYHMKTIAEYQSIFFDQARSLHFVEYLVAGLAVLAAMFFMVFRKRGTDWALVLVNVVFALLYARFLRATYFFAVVFLFTCAFLVRTSQEGATGTSPAGRGAKAALGAVLGAVVAFFSVRALFETFFAPGIGWNPPYEAPVEEARYIARHHAGARLGNDYATGAYLMWASKGRTKVFIDARYFPYKTWYDEYAAFEEEENQASFEELAEGYGCDVWCVSIDSPLAWRFLSSSRWAIAMYGRSAAVFVRPGEVRAMVRPDAERLAEGPGHYRKIELARFALRAGDDKTAAIVSRGACRDVAGSVRPCLSAETALVVGDSLARKRRYREAVQVLRSGAKCTEGLLPAVFARWDGCNARVAELHVHLGMALLAMMRPAEAATEFRKALAIEPGRVDASRLLAETVKRLDALSRTAAGLEEEARRRPSDLDVHRRLAAVLVMRGDLNRAYDISFALAKADPRHPEDLYNLACIQAMRGSTQEALEYLGRALDAGLPDPTIIETDPDLDPIRDTRAFRELLSRSKKG